MLSRVQWLTQALANRRLHAAKHTPVSWHGGEGVGEAVGVVPGFDDGAIEGQAVYNRDAQAVSEGFRPS